MKRLFLIFLLSLPGPAFSFNAVDLVKDSIAKDCLDYCLEGVCVFLVCKLTPPSCSIHMTPKVSYKQPDALVMVYSKQGEAPWDEWRNTIGKVMSSVEKPLVKALMGAEPNGGKTTLPNQGGTAHTLYFKNADVVGHPMAFLFNMLSSGRNNGVQFSLPKPNLGFGNQGEPEYPEPEIKDDVAESRFQLGKKDEPPTKQVSGNNLASKVKQSIPSPRDIGKQITKIPSKFKSTATENFKGHINKAKAFPGKVKKIFDKKEGFKLDSPAKSLVKDFGKFDAMNDARFDKIMDMGAIKESMSIQKHVGKFSKIAGNLDKAASAFGGGTGGNVFCPSEVGPMNPYFMSGIDTMGWRLGFPDRFSANTWIPTRNVVGSIIGNRWGKLYPRQGMIYSIDEHKASAVIAERAMHLVTRKDQKHVYAHLKGPAHEAGKGQWQMIHPSPSKSCKTFGSTRKFPFKTSKNGSYAFNYWRPYSCCLDPKGKHLKTIKAKLCL